LSLPEKRVPAELEKPLRAGAVVVVTVSSYGLLSGILKKGETNNFHAVPYRSSSIINLI
jgi:hypothetical protein